MSIKIIRFWILASVIFLVGLGCQKEKEAELPANSSSGNSSPSNSAAFATYEDDAAELPRRLDGVGPTEHEGCEQQRLDHPRQE